MKIYFYDKGATDWRVEAEVVRGAGSKYRVPRIGERVEYAIDEDPTPLYGRVVDVDYTYTQGKRGGHRAEVTLSVEITEDE